MRKTALLIALALLVSASLVAPSTSSMAAVGAGTSFSADASWFFPTKKPGVYTWYSASVWGSDDAAGDYVADIVKGTCRVPRNGNGIGCVGRFLGMAENEDVFEMDPVMQTAKLTLENEDGEPMTVTWSAKPVAPWVGSMEEVCDVGAAGEYFVHRSADAVADLGDKQLPEPAPINGWDMTYLRRGVGVDACQRGTRSYTGVRRYFPLR